MKPGTIFLSSTAQEPTDEDIRRFSCSPDERIVSIERVRTADGELFLLGAIAAGFYLMIKREVPYLLKRQLIGMYFLVASMLLLSHVSSSVIWN